MTHIKGIGLLALTGTLLSGCVDISIGNSGRRRVETTKVIAVPSPLSPADAATAAEVEAAASLSTDEGRLAALNQIAARPGLSHPIQILLVNKAYDSLALEKSRMSLLIQIIHNPAFTDGAREAIVTRINFLSLENSRQTILNELNQVVSNRPRQ